MKTVSEATVDLGHVVEAIKKIEEEGQGVSEEVKAEILKKWKSTPSTILEETGHISILNDLEPEDTAEEVESAPEKETETQEATSQSLEDLGLK